MKANGQTSQRSGKLSWGLLFVLCGAIFLEGIDVSMMGVALPSIRAELGMSTGSLQWVVSAYVLGYGGFMLLGGRAADLFGRRKMFLLWLTVFFAFSGLGGLSTEGWMLITARFVTGISAAFMTPAGLSSSRQALRRELHVTRHCSFMPGQRPPGFHWVLWLAAS